MHSIAEGESVITASDIESGGSEPQARWRHAAVCVRLDGVDHVVITGTYPYPYPPMALDSLHA